MRKIFIFTILLLFGTYGIILSTQNRLGIYIHPRFFLTSNIASIFAVVVGIVGILYTLAYEKKIKIDFINGKIILVIFLIGISFVISPLLIILALVILLLPHTKIVEYLTLQNILVITILSLALILPAKGLSSITASQRSIDLNSINLTESTNNTAKGNGFSDSTKNYSIGDWLASMSYNPDPAFYKGKDINLIGSVYSPDNLNLKSNNFLIARFIITCCAVDARPVGLKVRYDWHKDFKEDQWVRITGKFDIENNEIIIIPDKIEKTDPPANPYIT